MVSIYGTDVRWYQVLAVFQINVIATQEIKMHIRTVYLECTASAWQAMAIVWRTDEVRRKNQLVLYVQYVPMVQCISSVLSGIAGISFSVLSEKIRE